MDEYEFLSRLGEINALKFGEFILASGNQSKFYLDLRLIPSHPELFLVVGNKLLEKSASIKFDVIAGIPQAGVPFATYLAIGLKKPLIYLRKTPKAHGLKKQIEGIPITNKKVLLIDDLISSGHSKEFAIKAIRSEGGIVNDILLIIDRRSNHEEIRDWEASFNIRITSVFQYSAEKIIKFGIANNYLN